MLAATAVVTAVQAAVVATATEQDQQDDDPAPVTTAETMITHIKYLHRKIFEGFAGRSFHGIPYPQKGAKPAVKITAGLSFIAYDPGGAFGAASPYRPQTGQR